MANKKYMLIISIVGIVALLKGIVLHASFHTQASQNPWGACQQERAMCIKDCYDSRRSEKGLASCIGRQCEYIYTTCQAQKNPCENQFEICKKGCPKLEENKKTCMKRCIEHKIHCVRKKVQAAESETPRANGPEGIT